MSSEIKLANAIALAVQNAGGTAYYVGGCVRDMLLHRPCKDVDIEIHGIPEDALPLLLSAFGSVRSFGASYPLFFLNGLEISIPHTADGIPIPFSGTFAAAKRRDFTINALLQNILTGDITDHFGGVSDLETGILRHVEDSVFSSDALRVFRMAQFSARFGFSIAPETLTLAQNADVSRLPRERVEGELRKALLYAPKPSVFFEVLQDCGQLAHWFPELQTLTEIPQNPAYHPEGNVWNHTMMTVNAAAGRREQAHFPYYFMLSALVHDLGKIVATEQIDGVYHAYRHEFLGLPLIRKFLGRLTSDTKLTAYVLNMAELHMKPSALAIAGASRKSTNKLFDAALEPEDLIFLAESDCLGIGGKRDYSQNAAFLYERLELYRETMKKPHVEGKELEAAGVLPGEKMGEILTYAHKLRLAGIEKEDALRQCLAMARKLGVMKNKESVNSTMHRNK